jgi:7-cyano-7-deazaguanine synthase
LPLEAANVAIGPSLRRPRGARRIFEDAPSGRRGATRERFSLLPRPARKWKFEPPNALYIDLGQDFRRLYFGRTARMQRKTPCPGGFCQSGDRHGHRAMTKATAAALVLFSGGQDSTTCLALALDRYARVETVGFDYGQRHRVELGQRAEIREKLGRGFPAWRERLGDDHVIAIEALAQISVTAMTHDVAIAAGGGGLPNTFVPGRNLVFLTLAAAIAYRRGFKHIVGGMCETDFSGYPDCRDDTVKAMQLAVNLGMDAHFILETPLMWLDKAATWRLAETLGGTALVDLIREATHSCYLGERDVRHDWGYGCGSCPACRLRAEGWRKYIAP